MTKRGLRVGRHGGQFAVEMVTMENGCIFKSIHGDLYRNSIWYTVYGSMGRMETAREDAQAGDVHRLYVYKDEYDGGYETSKLATYEPHFGEENGAFGHGGSDFVTMNEFVKKILGDETADTIDVYEAMDMCLPGLFAYRSILAGGIPMDVPNLRDPGQRDIWRNDVACTVPAVAGDQLLPTFSKGTPDIPDSVYEEVARKWEAEKNGGYVKHVLAQGKKEEEE